MDIGRITAILVTNFFVKYQSTTISTRYWCWKHSRYNFKAVLKFGCPPTTFAANPYFNTKAVSFARIIIHLVLICTNCASALLSPYFGFATAKKLGYKVVFIVIGNL